MHTRWTNEIKRYGKQQRWGWGYRSVDWILWAWAVSSQLQFSERFPTRMILPGRYPLIWGVRNEDYDVEALLTQPVSPWRPCLPSALWLLQWLSRLAPYQVILQIVFLIPLILHKTPSTLPWRSFLKMYIWFLTPSLTLPTLFLSLSLKVNQKFFLQSKRTRTPCLPHTCRRVFPTEP